VGGPPGTRITFGPHGFTPSNSGGAVVLTSTGAVAGLTAAFGTPPGNTRQTNVSSTIRFPTADTYAFGAVLAGATAASSQVVARILLQLSHVYAALTPRRHLRSSPVIDLIGVPWDQLKCEDVAAFLVDAGEEGMTW
jgi:hypothetical protein